MSGADDSRNKVQILPGIPFLVIWNLGVLLARTFSTDIRHVLPFAPLLSNPFAIQNSYPFIFLQVWPSLSWALFAWHYLWHTPSASLELRSLCKAWCVQCTVPWCNHKVRSIYIMLIMNLLWTSLRSIRRDLCFVAVDLICFALMAVCAQA